MFTSALDSAGSPDAPKFLTPEDVARVLNIGRTSAYALLRTGELRSVRIGRLRRVPIGALDDFVERQLRQQDDDHQGEDL